MARWAQARKRSIWARVEALRERASENSRIFWTRDRNISSSRARAFSSALRISFSLILSSSVTKRSALVMVCLRM